MSNMHQRQRAFTLIELIFCIAITSISLSYAIPTFQSMLVKASLSANANALTGLLYRGKAAGASKGSVLLCGGSLLCEEFKQTHNIKLVHDKNFNRQFDAGEEILYEMDLPKGMTLSWNSFRGKPWIHFTHSGHLWFQNGNLQLCYKKMQQKVIVNKIGKTRIEKIETADRKCPP